MQLSPDPASFSVTDVGWSASSLVNVSINCSNLPASYESGQGIIGNMKVETIASAAYLSTITNVQVHITLIPSILSVIPGSSQQGQQNLSVALAGQYTNWVQGTTTASFGTGITVASLTVNSPTSATAVVSIDPAAATGPRTVTLTTGSEVATLENGFTVTAGTAILLSVTPASGRQGQLNIPITIIGQNTHFAQGTSQVSFGTGISVGSVAVTSETVLTVEISISPNATVGPRTVVVTTASEVASLSNGFAVEAGASTGPLAVSPGSALQGKPFPS